MRFLFFLVVLAYAEARECSVPSYVNETGRVSVWGDRNMDLLLCVTDYCSEPLRVCMLKDGCRNLMHCSSECQMTDPKCLLQKCSRAILGAGEGMKMFLNLTKCIGGHCPKAEDKYVKEDEELKAEEAACIEAVTPIVAQMNRSLVTPSNCMESFRDVTEQIHKAKDDCDDELDGIWAINRETVREGHLSYFQCKRRTNVTQNILQNILNDLTSEEQQVEQDIEHIRYRRGENRTCENHYFGEDGEAWVDSDGDSCTVYKQFICHPGRHWTRADLERSCVSGNCAGTGGMYAYQACCACGGGRPPVAPNPEDEPENPDEPESEDPKKTVERLRSIISEKCMLSKCIERLGDCQNAQKCTDGLEYLSNKACEIGGTIQSCCDEAYTNRTQLNTEASAALLGLMDCALKRNIACEQAEIKSDDSQNNDEGSGNDKGENHQVGLIVGLTFLGVFVVGVAAGIGYTVWKRGFPAFEFHRVRLQAEDGPPEL